MRPLFKLNSLLIFLLLILPIIGFVVCLVLYGNNKHIIDFPVFILTDIFIFLQLFLLLFFAKETIAQIKLFKLSKMLSVILVVLLFVSLLIIRLSFKKVAHEPTFAEMIGGERSYISYLTQFKTIIYLVLIGLLLFSYYSIATQMKKNTSSNIISNFLKLCFLPLTIGWLKRKIEPQND